MTHKIFAAMKAFIIHEGRVLLIRESTNYEDGTNAGKYDVVGGRVESGERFDDGLIREIREETGLDVDIGRPFFVNEWRPKKGNENWQIIATFFECSTRSKQVCLGSDHSQYIWIDPSDYKNYPVIPNLKPAFEAYIDFKQSQK